jgi:hypothetical protein
MAQSGDSHSRSGPFAFVGPALLIAHPSLPDNPPPACSTAWLYLTVGGHGARGGKARQVWRQPASRGRAAAHPVPVSTTPFRARWSGRGAAWRLPAGTRGVGRCRAAPAGGRGGAPGGGGWPWLSHAGTPGSAAPDGPGAAPCAGVAWTAGVLVRGSGRHYAGRETAPVSRCSGRIARHVPGAGIVVCGRCPLSEGRSAPSGPLWLRRSGPRKACGPQLRRHLPQGSLKVWGQLRSPHGQSAPLSPACQRSVAGAVWHGRPAR